MRNIKDFFEKHAVWFVFVMSVVTSIVATAYYFHKGEILAYNDARSHLDIARSVIDSKTPGITQLGAVWLPLPHILMLPFIANYMLWHTGLAGSFVAMISFVISALLIFKIIQILSKSVYISVLGSLIFISNPNILYMQSTPMTELPLIATMLFGSYYFIKWLYTRQTSHLVMAALGVMLSTLARYEGWFVLVTCTCIILFDSIVLTKKLKEGEGQAVLFATLGAFGIFLWFMWNLVIFGDPLYFYNGPYSAQAQQNLIAAAGNLPTKHNLSLSLITIEQAVSLNAGRVVILAALIGLVVVLYKKYKEKNIVYALLVLAAPIVLDLITLFQGSITITTTLPHTFNIRYGVMAIPFIAVLIALAISIIRLPRYVKIVLGVSLIIASLMAVPVTIKYDATQGAGAAASNPAITAFERIISKDYTGGNILASDFSFNPLMQQVGLPLKDYINEGNYHIWDNTLIHPQNNAKYALLYDSGGSTDAVYKDYLKRKALFNKYYYVAYNKGGYELLILKGQK